MTEHGSELRVGITLTIAGAALVFGILWLSDVQFGDERYELSIVFPEVAGLVPGDKVTVAGLDAGEIISLDLEGNQVVVKVEIDPDIKIPDDSRISVASYGLIGAKVVAVRPGMSGVYIEAGSRVDGIYEKALGDVVSEMGEALTEIRGVMRMADEVLSDMEGRDQIKETITNARDATVDLKVAVGDIRAMAADLRSFVEAKTDDAENVIDTVGEASQNFAEVSAELATISATLDSLVTRIEAGEGTLGKIVTDDSAYNEFTAAVTEVRDLVAEIRTNPKNFIRFSIW